MTNSVHEGGCVCSEVRYKVHAEPSIVVVCHCEWCQRRTGSAFAVIPKFEIPEFELCSGELKIYREINEYGRWLDLGFCVNCGTNIGFTQQRRPTARAIDAGTFDDPSWITPSKHEFRYIFTRTNHDWTNIPEGSLCYEGQLPTNY